MKKLTLSLLVGLTIIGIDAYAVPENVKLSIQNSNGRLEEVRNPNSVWDASTFSQALNLAGASHLRGNAEIKAKKFDGSVETFTESQWEQFRKAYKKNEFASVEFGTPGFTTR